MKVGPELVSRVRSPINEPKMGNNFIILHRDIDVILAVIQALAVKGTAFTLATEQRHRR